MKMKGNTVLVEVEKTKNGNNSASVFLLVVEGGGGMKNAYDPGRGSGVSLRSALSRGKKQKAAGMGKEGDAERTKEESEKPTPAKKNPRESFFLSPFVAVALFCSPAPSFAFFPCFASLFLFLSLSLSILSLSPQLRYAFLGDLLGLGGVERLRPGGSTSLGPATK